MPRAPFTNALTRVLLHGVWLATVMLAAPASAQDTGEPPPRIYGKSSVEATLGVGFANGIGRLIPSPDPALGVSAAGVAVDLGVDYRFSPLAALGVGAAYQFHPESAAFPGQTALDERMHGLLVLNQATSR